MDQNVKYFSNKWDRSGVLLIICGIKVQFSGPCLTFHTQKSSPSFRYEPLVLLRSLSSMFVWVAFTKMFLPASVRWGRASSKWWRIFPHNEINYFTIYIVSHSPTLKLQNASYRVLLQCKGFFFSKMQKLGETKKNNHGLLHSYVGHTVVNQKKSQCNSQ